MTTSGDICTQALCMLSHVERGQNGELPASRTTLQLWQAVGHWTDHQHKPTPNLFVVHRKASSSCKDLEIKKPFA